MNATAKRKALSCAVNAAQSAGKLMRQNLRKAKKIDSQTQHDIKLALDVRCQKLIERALRRRYPAISILGEEGVLGPQDSEFRWVVDPIDGTVNFTYGIPHACVSIALQQRTKSKAGNEDYQTILGVVYDPFCNELWTAIRGQQARLNGKPISVSPRRKLKEAIVGLGFAKEKRTLNKMLPVLNGLIPRVRKIRILGAAALSMTYVATGRLDAYLEYGLRLWDIAAGGLIVECAGGEFWRRPVEGEHAYEIVVSNGPLRKQLQKIG